MRAVLWRGISRLDGRTPIVLLANGPSLANTKTGPMVQTWILVEGTDPRDATRTRADVAICGHCPMLDACYVGVAHGGPLQSWRGYRAGKYRDLSHRADRRAAVRGLGVRGGSYGDPAAVPVDVWDDVCGAASHHTGYTHQWRDGFALADRFMASTETDAGTDHAESMGWRTYQIVESADVTPRPGAVWCPHHATGGRVTCNACGLCNGGRGKHVINPVHGPRHRRALPVLQGAA